MSTTTTDPNDSLPSRSTYPPEQAARFAPDPIACEGRFANGPFEATIELDFDECSSEERPPGD